MITVKFPKGIKDCQCGSNSYEFTFESEDNNISGTHLTCLNCGEQTDARVSEVGNHAVQVS